VTAQVECSELHVANGEFFGSRMKSWLEDSDAVVLEDVEERGLASVVKAEEQEFCIQRQKRVRRAVQVRCNILACLFSSPSDESTSQTIIRQSQSTRNRSHPDGWKKVLHLAHELALRANRFTRAVRHTSQESTCCRTSVGV
jgi:hypothetical protein